MLARAERHGYRIPQATTCDPVAGVCVPGDLSSLFETGHACDPKIASRQCLGDCIPLDDQNQQGICVDPCVAAVPGSCGGLDHGLCFLDTSGVVAAGKPVSLGPLDVGGCAESAGPTEDAACYWEGGFFPMSLLFAGEAPRAYCLQARTCDGDASCIEDCKVATDCGHGDAVCTGGKCTVNDTCRDVGSKKYCLDHAPTVP